MMGNLDDLFVNIKLDPADLKIIEEAKEAIKLLHYIRKLNKIDKTNFIAMTEMPDQKIKELTEQAHASGNPHAVELMQNVAKFKKFDDEGII